MTAAIDLGSTIYLVGPSELALAVTLVHPEVAFVLVAVAHGYQATAAHLVVLPRSFVAVAVDRDQHAAFAPSLSVFEVAFEPVAVLVVERSAATDLAVTKFAHIAITAKNNIHRCII